MKEKKDFWDKASDFLEKHWGDYAYVCWKERQEKARKDKEICDKLRKDAVNPFKVYKDENGEKLSFCASIPKRFKIFKATKKHK